MALAHNYRTARTPRALSPLAIARAQTGIKRGDQPKVARPVKWRAAYRPSMFIEVTVPYVPPLIYAFPPSHRPSYEAHVEAWDLHQVILSHARWLETGV